jgi:hypothetical protein
MDFVGMVKQVEQTCKQQQWRRNEKTDCITNRNLVTEIKQVKNQQRKRGLLQESAD